MKTSIATVSISGSLVEKLHACAAAGFDGVEIFEPDLIASDHSPEEIRESGPAARPVARSVPAAARHRGGRRGHVHRQPAPRRGDLRHRAAARHRHGAGLQQRRDGDRRLRRALRRPTPQTRRRRAATTASGWPSKPWRGGASSTTTGAPGASSNSPTIPPSASAWTASTCCPADTTPRRSSEIPGDKIFYLQLADAPALSMDVLSWSRHHRLFPGEGAFDLPTFVAHVLATGFDGPLSLEVFNDTFRQTDPDRTAVHALRSLVWLQDKVAALHWSTARRRADAGHRCQAAGRVRLRRSEGRGHQRRRGAARPARLHSARPTPYEAGVALGGRRCPHRAQRAAGPRPGSARRRRRLAGARRGGHLATGRRPDGARRVSPDLRLRAAARWRRRARRHRVLLGHCTARWIRAAWVDEFENGLPAAPGPSVRNIDHVNLAMPWQTADEAVLFLTSVFGLSADAPTEVAGPSGLVRSQVMRTDDGSIRLPLNVAPQVLEEVAMPQHVAFACTDVDRTRPCRPGAGTALPRGAGQLLRLRCGPVRCRRGGGRRIARTRPALRPQRNGRLRALLHPHRRHRVLRVRPADRRLRRLRRRQRPRPTGRSTPAQYRRTMNFEEYRSYDATGLAKLVADGCRTRSSRISLAARR